MPRRYDYRGLVDRWSAVCDSDQPEAEKFGACRALLREFIDELALLAFRAPHPALRFYAYMWAFEADVRPRIGSNDNLCRYAVRPSWDFIRDWRASHSLGL
jgi:hypothetical protein